MTNVAALTHMKRYESLKKMTRSNLATGNAMHAAKYAMPKKRCVIAVIHHVEIIYQSYLSSPYLFSMEIGFVKDVAFRIFADVRAV